MYNINKYLAKKLSLLRELKVIYRGGLPNDQASFDIWAKEINYIFERVETINNVISKEYVDSVPDKMTISLREEIKQDLEQLIEQHSLGADVLSKELFCLKNKIKQNVMKQKIATYKQNNDIASI